MQYFFQTKHTCLHYSIHFVMMHVILTRKVSLRLVVNSGPSRPRKLFIATFSEIISRLYLI